MNEEINLHNKKVLITGGFGFIGSNLARRLLLGKNEITLLDYPGKSKERINEIKDKIKSVEVDVSDKGLMTEIVKNKDIIFHLAWQTDLKKSMDRPREDTSKDVIGTINILEACKEYNKNVKILFASTTTVVGFLDSNVKLPINESIRENPLSVYEVNKLCSEKYLYMYYENYGLKTCVLRLSNVFGERQRIDNPNRGILNFMIGRALRGEELTVYGDGNFIRDYCYVQNYIDAFILAALSNETNGKVFVLGSGEGRTFNEVVESIKKYVEALTNKEKKVKITHVPFPEGENKINMRNFVADYSSFNKITAWTPKVNFNDALKKTIDFYLNMN